MSTATSPSPEAPKAAACADSRSRPSSRLATSNASERAPARRNMVRDYVGSEKLEWRAYVFEHACPAAAPDRREPADRRAAREGARAARGAEARRRPRLPQRF